MENLYCISLSKIHHFLHSLERKPRLQTSMQSIVLSTFAHMGSLEVKSIYSVVLLEVNSNKITPNQESMFKFSSPLLLLLLYLEIGLKVKITRSTRTTCVSSITTLKIGHYSTLLIFSHPLLKEVRLPLQTNHIHPIKRVLTVI